MSYDVVIIGAGLNGICAGYYCKKNNYKYLILEKNGEIGGIWTSRNVPGIRTDSSAGQYTYSFNRDHVGFGTVFPSGSQIAKYITETSEKFGISENIVFNTEVLRATFNSKKNKWQVSTKYADYSCSFLINCNGYFDKKKYYTPKFKGMDTFKGSITHIYDIKSPEIYENKKVLLVGSGAMAISSMSTIYKYAKDLNWCQRTPSYIKESTTKLSLRDHIYQKIENDKFHSVASFVEQARNDLIFIVFRNFPVIGKAYFKHQYKRLGISDKYISDHLTPPYNPWDQRIPVASPGLLKLLGSGKIKTHTTSIDHFTENTVKLKNGTVLDNIDTVIMATGFNIDLCQFDMYIDKEKINFDSSMQYFKHIMISDIPNYFQIVGTLHSTYTVKIELLYRLVFDVINFTVKNSYDRVQTNPSCEFKKTEPNLKTNYLARSIEKIPKTTSLYDIPALDRLDNNYEFEISHYKYSSSSPTGTAFTNFSCKRNNKRWLLVLLVALLIILLLPNKWLSCCAFAIILICVCCLCVSNL